jgi:hypothetical protein
VPPGKSAQRACAEQIVTRIGHAAYRRPLTRAIATSLMKFYDQAREGRRATRSRRRAHGAAGRCWRARTSCSVSRRRRRSGRAARTIAIDDFDLASRLSFFLWGSIPDAALLSLASQQQLSEAGAFNAEVKRMLADPRSEALSTRFAAQWLRLQDLEKVHPDAFLFPDFDLQLANAMQRETELLFNDILRNDRNILDLFTANYTFVNERLARHYGIPNVSGGRFPACALRR